MNYYNCATTLNLKVSTWLKLIILLPHIAFIFVSPFLIFACTGVDFIESEFEIKCNSIVELLTKFIVAYKLNHPNKIHLENDLVVKWIEFYTEHQNRIPPFLADKITTNRWQEFLNQLGKNIYAVTKSLPDESVECIYEGIIITFKILPSGNLLDKVNKSIYMLFQENFIPTLNEFNMSNYSEMINLITFKLEKNIIEPSLFIIYTFSNQVPFITTLISRKLEDIRNIWQPVVKDNSQKLDYNQINSHLQEIYSIADEIKEIFINIPGIKLFNTHT